jgi:integrase/recombinase XerD
MTHLQSDETVVEDLQRWRENFKVRLVSLGRSEKTIELYLRSVDFFIEYMRPYETKETMGTINSMTIDYFLAFLENQSKQNYIKKYGVDSPAKNKYLSDSSRRSYMKGIKAFFDFITRVNTEEHSYERLFPRKERQSGGKPDQITHDDYLLPGEVDMLAEELERCIDEVEGMEQFVMSDGHEPSPDHKRFVYAKVLLIKFMLFAGLRVSEALQVRLEDIRPSPNGDDELLLHVDRAKGGHPAQCPILKEHIEREYDFFKKLAHDEGLSSMPIFITQKRVSKQGRLIGGKAMSRTSAYLYCDAMYRAAGLKERKGAHLLRHTFAMQLIQNGVDVLTVKELLRHRRIEATMIYVRANDMMKSAGLRAVRDRLN